MGRSGTRVGVLLAASGLAVLLVCSIPIMDIEKVIDISFVVGSGIEYGPPNAGTGYHTRVLGKSILRGEVLVEGEGIHLTVHGYNTQNLADVCVEGRYSFVVNPANDLYTFAFRNMGANGSLVHLKLEEIWTRPMGIGSPPLFISGLVTLALFSAGTLISVVTHLRRSQHAIQDLRNIMNSIAS